MNDPKFDKILAALLKEAKEFVSNGKGRTTNSEMFAWIDGATAALAIVDPTFRLSNAALEMLEEWDTDPDGPYTAADFPERQ